MKQKISSCTFLILKLMIDQLDLESRDISCLKKSSVVEINLSMPVGLQTSL